MSTPIEVLFLQLLVFSVDAKYLGCYSSPPRNTTHVSGSSWLKQFFGNVAGKKRLVYNLSSLAGAGWSSLAARRAHNPKVTGSNPVPATKTVL